MTPEIIGYIADTCTTTSIVPQIYKAWVTKDVQDVSLFMFVILLMGVLGWTIYGWILNDWPIIIFNGLSLLLNLSMLYLILTYSNKKQA